PKRAVPTGSQRAFCGASHCGQLACACHTPTPAAPRAGYSDGHVPRAGFIQKLKSVGVMTGVMRVVSGPSMAVAPIPTFCRNWEFPGVFFVSDARQVRAPCRVSPFAARE